MTDAVTILVDMQRQLSELAARVRDREKRKGYRRVAAYDPPEPPGPKPDELAIARAKRLLHGAR